MRFVRPLIAAIAVLAALPAVSSAAPVAAGTYQLQSTGGQIHFGGSAPYDMAYPAANLGGVTVSGTDPVPVSVPASTLQLAPAVATATVGTTTFTADVTATMVGNATGTLDPATGNLTLQVPFRLNVKERSSPPVFDCDIGTDAAPILPNNNTANGAAWDGASALTAIDNTFIVPAADCHNQSITDLFNGTVGLPSQPGSTVSTLNLSLTAATGPVPPPTGGGGGGTTTPGAGGGGSTITGTPKITFGGASRNVTVKDGTVGLKVECAKAAKCEGEVALSRIVPNKKASSSRRVKLGSKKFEIAAGKSLTVKIKLSKAARAVLKRNRRLAVTATFTIDGVKKATTRKLVLKLPAAKRKAKNS